MTERFFSIGETMTKTRRTLALATFLLMAGCASWQTPSEALSNLPVVKFGDPIPADRDYVLFFPPDTPITTTVSIKGSIFAKEAEQTLIVTLRRGIYSHKNWMSYDRVTWLDGRTALKTNVGMQFPGYVHPEPGWVKIRMDERN